MFGKFKSIISFLTLFSFSLAVDWDYFRTHYEEIPVPTPRIVNGEPVNQYEYPHHVGIFIANKTQFCGGSLISTRYVLTAAHCAVRMTIHDKVILGGFNLLEKESSQVFGCLSKIIVHDEFDERTWYNDIALLKLLNHVILRKDIWPIAFLPRSVAEDADLVGQIVTITGWGRTYDPIYPPTYDVKVMSSVPMKADVFVIPWEKCITIWNSVFADKKDEYFKNSTLRALLSKQYFCLSGYKSISACRMDCGSPVIFDGRLIGLFSQVGSNCEQCAPSIFVNVGYYLDWIKIHSNALIL